jgi:4-amino-4-deoxy-L-arabinose transferase-like glycosyltransferase
VPLVAALVAPWYVAACARGGEAFCRELVLRQNLDMFFDTWSHAQPVWYYAAQLPWMFLPWTLVLPLALRGLRPTASDTRLLVVWIAFTFLFFSASEAKQAKYLLPVVPPLAILVGRWIAASEPRERRAGVTVALFLGAAVLARWIALPRADAFKLPLALTERAAALGHPVAVHGIAWRQLGGLVYYGQRQLPLLESQADLAAWMRAPEPRLAYVDREDWDGSYELVAASDYRDGTVLLANGRRESP